MGIKVKFKQPTNYNCGLYAVSNVLNDDFLLKEEYLCGGGDGHSIFDINNLLVKEGKDFHITAMYVDIINKKLPEDFGLFPQTEQSISPFVMITAQSVEGVYHMVAIHSFHNQTVHIIDSLKDDVIETTFDKLHDYYPVIEGFYALKTNDKKDDGYLMVSYQ